MESSRPNNLATLPQAVESTDTLRDPPVNLEAEQALLAAILANNTAYERVAEFLLPEHFADPIHARIYEACGKLLDQSRLANAITLKNLFAQSDELAEIGGAQYLAQLQSSYVSIINARDYARTVHDLYLRRQLIGLGDDMVNDAFDYDPDVNAMAQIEKAEMSLYNLAESGEIEGGLKPFKSAITESIEMAEAAFRREGHLVGIPTDLKDLDSKLGGLHKSDLIILAARPSMGKTALATNIAFNAASSKRQEMSPDGTLIERNEVVAFFSLEMSAEQLATRILSQQTKIRSDTIRRGDIKTEDFDSLFEWSHALQTLPLFIDDTPSLTIPALRTRARRLKRQHGLSLIIVDYLQLMHSVQQKRNDNRVQEVSEISRGLKAVAKELDVPVLALAQLSRAPEQRDDKRPQLSDLRESGSIEQDADVVMFLYRDEYYRAREKPSKKPDQNDFSTKMADWERIMDEVRNVAEVIIAKQRHGPIGDVKLHFTAELTHFENHIGPDHVPYKVG